MSSTSPCISHHATSLAQEGTQTLLSLLETLGPATPVPDGELPSETPNFRTMEKSRHLILMQCTQAEVFPYCVQLLMACLKVGPTPGSLSVGFVSGSGGWGFFPQLSYTSEFNPFLG